MTRRRLIAIGLQFVVACQALGYIPVVPSPATPTVRAADGCTVTAGGGGGIVSACADAATYADFAAALDVGFDNLRGAQTTSSLTVSTDQAGAAVSLNGLPAGVTPLDAKVPAGTYLVRITKDGFVPFSRTITIGGDTPGTVTATLEPTGGSAGSFEWVRAETLIGVANGFPGGGFDITGYVRDKDGVDYVSFTNSKTVEVEFEEPTEIAGYAEWLKSDRDTVSLVGVAKSTDDGRTWTLVKSWTGSYTARTWTSERFVDGEWKAGDPGIVKEHWIRAYYHEERQERYLIGGMAPRAGGGVNIEVTKVIAHQPQELMRIWDNLTRDYCRADDATPECLGRDHPGRYIGSLTPPYTDSLVEDAGGTYRRVANARAISRYGVSAKDLATYNLVREITTTAYDSTSGGELKISAFDNLPYQGSHEGADYYLGIVADCCSTEGAVYVARDGGAPVLAATYHLGADAPKGSKRFEELHIGPDGTVYVLDHVRGRVYTLATGGGTAPTEAQLLGEVDPTVYGGLLGVIRSDFNYLSAAVDSGGNVHVAFRVAKTAASGGNPTEMDVYYEYFPRQKEPVDSVALITAPDCAACDEARRWLTDAGVTFEENPANLPADVVASVGAARAADGLPVVVRQGPDDVVRGGADPAAISRLLGVAHPVLVDTHAIRVGRTAGGRLIGYQPDWVLLILEGDAPRVIVQRDEGVVALAPAAGGWASSLVLASPPPVPVDEYIDPSDGLATIDFNPRYPIFPGGYGTPYVATARDVPFNAITKVSDLRFLFRSDAGGGSGRYSYTLHTATPSATSSAYRAVAQVSQLIPATAFDVLLGSGGSASEVRGELAAYVTSQGTVTDGADRLQHIVVDLRAQGETAIDGNLQARAIGGSITVQTKAADGTAETRDIGLILFVDNTRLRLVEPEPGGRAQDLTAEAVHFTGANERWVVTNNLGLPNSVPCGPDQAILLPPHSTSTFTADEVASFGLGSCLDALEVAPTVLAGCSSWADAQLVLAAQTIDALGSSLALERTEGSTNYELAFGSRDATVRRIISIDEFHGAGPACATDLTGSTAAVVGISGRILGDGEAFLPLVTVIDSGVDAVATAATALPTGLAWEREWLEFEAAFLEISLRTSIADEALSSVMFLSTAGKKLGYQRQLLATRALLHCNYEGVDVGAVVALVERSAGDANALRRTAICLQDFVLHSTKHWPSFDRALWAGGQFQVGFVGTVINSSLAANPTLGFLVAAAKGDPATYGAFVIARAKALEARAAADADVANQATDFALDHLARVLTATGREMTGPAGALAKVVLMSGPVERSAIRIVLDCARGFGGANPFPKLLELTQSRSYTAGIPCVEQQSGAEAKVAAYRGLVVGIRGGTFAALLEASGRDLDLLYSHLDLVRRVISQVDAAESKYPKGTSVDTWNADLPAVDRFVIVRRHAEAMVEARGRRITVGEAAQVLQGVAECGTGLVKGLFSGEGILMLGLGVGAAVAGPMSAAVGGVAFFLSGVAFTGLAVTSLAQMWEGMDLTAKTAGVCGAAASALMTGVAFGGAYKGVRGWTPAEVRAAPPKTIKVDGAASRGKGSGAPLEAQTSSLTKRGASVADQPVEPAIPAEASLEAVVRTTPRAKQPIIRALAERMDYRAMTAAARAVFDDMARAYGSPGGLTAMLERRAAQIEALTQPGNAAGAADAWIRIGGAIVVDLMPGRPKSLQVKPTAAGLVGSDAELVLAAADDGLFTKLSANARRGVSTEDLQAATSLTQAFLRSDRTRTAIEAAPGARALQAEEAAYLAKLQQASRPGLKSPLSTSLAGRGIIDALREGIATARQTYGIPADAAVTGMTAEYVASGVFKSAYRLKVTIEGQAAPLDIAFKKGIITDAEFALLVELGGKGLMQKPFLKGPLKAFDGLEAVSIEEWVPGDTILLAFRDPTLASAMGKFDARVFLRTVRGTGDAARAYFNKDLHWDNLKAYTEGGGLTVRAIDFDPQFLVQATTEQYFASSLMRRGYALSFGVPNMKGYLQGIVDAFAAEPGGSAEAGLAMLRRARTSLNDPALRTDALSVGRYPSVTDLNATAARVVADIDAFLAGQ